jgi:hypothetical protein
MFKHTISEFLREHAVTLDEKVYYRFRFDVYCIGSFAQSLTQLRLTRFWQSNNTHCWLNLYVLWDWI